MTWVKAGDGTAAVNLDRTLCLGVRNTGTNEYKIGVFPDGPVSSGTPVVYLDGTWTTAAAAMEAVRELTQASDPTTFGD